MRLLSILLISTLLFSCNSKAQDKKEMKEFAINKTEAEWKTQLTENEFYILREAGTERPFTSNLLENKKTGTYVCAACETPLFESGTKFDSGTGWPSFYQEIEGNVAFDTDYNLGYARTEEVCATCGGHLGHVFKDGPDPTGERHCINGGALNFIPKSNE